MVLKINPLGENHRGITLLVRGKGLLRPLAFGAQGRRSQLRGTAVPFHSGMAGLYHDPVKNHWRLSSFDILASYDGLRETLDAFYTASAWAEILLKTHGGGMDSARLYDLSAQALSLLSRAGGPGGDFLTILFLWRFLAMEGVLPDLHTCGRCGRFLGAAEEAWLGWHGLMLGSCCRRERSAPLPLELRRWLPLVGAMPLEQAVEETLEGEAVPLLKKWLFDQVERLLDRPLISLK